MAAPVPQARPAVPQAAAQALESATWLPALMAEVEERLAGLTRDHGEALSGQSAATLAAGGKRLRPMLVLLCAGADAAAAAVPAATAVELVHMATLVHDDVLDEAPLRRGAPTVVATLGPERATTVGDFLFSRAFAELARPHGSEPQVALLAATAVSLAQGELAQRRDSFDLGIDAERYLERCRLKTASLFECACRIGRLAAITDNGNGADRDLQSFGREIGIAFQLLDDVLDVQGPSERTGKARGTDLLDGTVTMPLIIARRRDPDLAAFDLRALTPEAAEAACDRIAAAGALDEVREQARVRIATGKRSLRSGNGIDLESIHLLELVADSVVERYS